MSEELLYDKLVLLNTAYQNTIVESKLPFVLADSIRTPLYPHQTRMVQGMNQYREKMTRGFMIGKEAINGKVGIVGDPVGTGKTLSILAYLASYLPALPRMTSELTPHSSTYFFSHEIVSLSESSANLIIVPHHLFGQWQSEIKKHTTLSYVPIETKRMIKGENMLQTILQSRFILTTNKCYRFVQEYATQHGIQWDNVFVDEATSIYIRSSDPPLRFQFLWLITNNWISLLFKQPTIVKSSLFFLRDRVNLHPDLEHWLLDDITTHYHGTIESYSFLKDYLPFFHKHRSQLIIRNARKDLDASITLPSMSNMILSCRPNITLQSLSSFYLIKHTDPIIRSRSIPTLFQALSISCGPLSEYLLNQPVQKHALIKRKVDEQECVICMETCEYPSMVRCCHNLYCGKCLLRNTILTFKCPTCRSIVDTASIHCFTTFSEPMLSTNKMDACIELCKQNRQGKLIIYSSFDNIYYQLFEEIDKLGMKAERIENNLFSLRKTIRNFQEGNTNILFISNVDVIRGLSLPATTHLIFYHELPVSEQKQILIHSSQRVGRTQPLQIYHLNSEIPI